MNVARTTKSNVKSRATRIEMKNNVFCPNHPDCRLLMYIVTCRQDVKRGSKLTFKPIMIEIKFKSMAAIILAATIF